MRLISQDRTIDIPYENSLLSVFCVEYVEPKRTIICCRNSCLKEEEKIAEYSTKEKAVKAMEMLREQYKKYVGASANIYGVFQFPQGDEVEV